MISLVYSSFIKIPKTKQNDTIDYRSSYGFQIVTGNAPNEHYPHG